MVSVKAKRKVKVHKDAKGRYIKIGKKKYYLKPKKGKTESDLIKYIIDKLAPKKRKRIVARKSLPVSLNSAGYVHAVGSSNAAEVARLQEQVKTLKHEIVTENKLVKQEMGIVRYSKDEEKEIVLDGKTYVVNKMLFDKYNSVAKRINKDITRLRNEIAKNKKDNAILKESNKRLAEEKDKVVEESKHKDNALRDSVLREILGEKGIRDKLIAIIDKGKYGINKKGSRGSTASGKVLLERMLEKKIPEVEKMIEDKIKSKVKPAAPVATPLPVPTERFNPLANQSALPAPTPAPAQPGPTQDEKEELRNLKDKIDIDRQSLIDYKEDEEKKKKIAEIERMTKRYNELYNKMYGQNGKGLLMDPPKLGHLNDLLQFGNGLIDVIKQSGGMHGNYERSVPVYIQPITREQQMKGFGRALYTDDIDRIMSRYSEYLGTIARDQIKDLLPKIKPRSRIGFVMNTDPSTKNGSHWVSVYIDARPNGSNSVEYYDSFADPAPADVRKNLKLLVEKLKPDTYLKFKENMVKQQSDNSANCGYFAARFLIDRFRGVPFSEATGYDEKIKHAVKENEAEIEALKNKPPFSYINDLE